MQACESWHLLHRRLVSIFRTFFVRGCSYVLLTEQIMCELLYQAFLEWQKQRKESEVKKRVE